jgi:hypothetical protein
VSSPKPGGLIFGCCCFRCLGVVVLCAWVPAVVARVVEGRLVVCP